jgi:hypothetical protein
MSKHSLCYGALNAKKAEQEEDNHSKHLEGRLISSSIETHKMV